jgi:hypothetical protein
MLQQDYFIYVTYFQRAKLAIILRHRNLVDARRHCDVLLFQDVHASGLRSQLQVLSLVRIFFDVDLFQRIVDSASVQSTPVDSHSVDLVAVSHSFNAIVLAAVGGPPRYVTIVGPGEDQAAIFVQFQNRYRFVVTLDNPERFRGVVYVQIVDEAAQGDGEQMFVLPQT